MHPTTTLLLAMLLIGPIAGCAPGIADSRTQTAGSASAAEPTAGEVDGRTQPAPGRRAQIASKVLDSVEQVLVVVGDRVKKGQALVVLSSDEQQADLKHKKATLVELQHSLNRLREEPRQADLDEAKAVLENLQISTRASRSIYERIEALWKSGSISEQRLYEARDTLAKAQADERASTARLTRLLKRPYNIELAEMTAKVAEAEADVEQSQASIEDYTVRAAIDGVVTRLDVQLGSVPFPGKTVWGEILDLNEIDVRCEMTPAAAAVLKVGRAARVTAVGRTLGPLKGQVVTVGIAAEPRSGLVPVLVRLPNQDAKLVAFEPVRVRFADE